MRRPLASIALVALLSGCASQIDALAPVSGDSRSGLRSAAIDVLLDRQLSVREAPDCVDVDDGWSCVGSLTDGSPIVVTAPGPTLETMTVLVGDIVVYEGSVMDVLDQAAQDTGEVTP